MATRFYGCFLLFLGLLIAGCQSESYTQVNRRVDRGSVAAPVTVADQGTHYSVTLNFKTDATHGQIGRLYGLKVRQLIADFEPLVDSYLSELTQDNDALYAVFLRRVEDIKPQIPADYRQEIDGFAGAFSGGPAGRRNDGKLSVDEIYLLNLVPDVARVTQCNALAVFGSRSKTRSTMLERTLDWPCGLKGQLARLQAVTTIKNGDKSVCLVGYLGFLGAVSAFNNDRVFAAILDAPTGGPYRSAHMRSYPLDLRWALENETSLTGIAACMKDPARSYAFSHLIFLADERTAAVLENNIGTGPHALRALRSDTSPLNDAIAWGFPNAVAAVNGFVLRGNDDNFSHNPHNVARWQRFRSLLQGAGSVIDLPKLKAIAAFHSPRSEKGDLYNNLTQQIMLFHPETMSLQIFFRPRDARLPDAPTFETVVVSFAP